MFGIAAETMTKLVDCAVRATEAMERVAEALETEKKEDSKTKHR